MIHLIVDKKKIKNNQHDKLTLHLCLQVQKIKIIFPVVYVLTCMRKLEKIKFILKRFISIFYRFFPHVFQIHLTEKNI